MSLNVLVVSDLARVSEVANKQLYPVDAEFQLTEVKDLNQVRRALALNTFDFVICSYAFGNLKAQDVLRIVNAFDLHLPFILITQSDDEESAAIDIMDLGATDFVNIDKPQRLTPIVKRELEQLRLKRTNQAALERLNYLAYHDSLTGLFNRFRIEEILGSAINFAQRSNTQSARDYLLYIDLDQFKVINDVCGHVDGDQVLRQVGQILAKELPSGAKPAHVNADVFAIFLPNASEKEAIELAEELIYAVNQFEYHWSLATFKVGASIGIMPITRDIKDASHLLSLADLACLAAKENGRNQWHFSSYDDDHVSIRQQQMARVSQIQHALQEDRFQLWVQPIVPVEAPEATCNYEFLVRMIDENGHLLAPGLFIPAAEKFKISSSLDQWVIKEAIRIVSQIDAIADQQFFINLSGTTFSDRALPDLIQKWLKQYQVAPTRLCFEITETAAVINYQRTLDFITGIRELGCSVALDDFGSGMSSFNYLRQFPVDYMKVDGQFVVHMLENRLDHTIVDSFNKIGHETGLKTVAEFVENEQLLAALNMMGVDFAQGYGICPPKEAYSFFRLGKRKQEAENV